MHTSEDRAQAWKRGGDYIAKKQITLSDIAEVLEFPETLKTVDLVGQTFTINNVKAVTTQFGETFVGDLTLDGKNVEAWLSGNVVFRQVTWLVENDKLPTEVTLTRDANKFGEPFRLD